jgi:hypothetical protein
MKKLPRKKLIKSEALRPSYRQAGMGLGFRVKVTSLVLSALSWPF